MTSDAHENGAAANGASEPHVTFHGFVVEGGFARAVGDAAVGAMIYGVHEVAARSSLMGATQLAMSLYQDRNEPAARDPMSLYSGVAVDPAHDPLHDLVGLSAVFGAIVLGSGMPNANLFAPVVGGMLMKSIPGRSEGDALHCDAPTSAMFGDAIGGISAAQAARELARGGQIHPGGTLGQQISRRTLAGQAIDIATGEVIISERDFVFGGPLQVPMVRTWMSSSCHVGALGNRWHHSLDWALVDRGSYCLLRNDRGRLIVLPALAPGQCFHHRAEMLTATRDRAGWLLGGADGRLRRFVAAPGRPETYRLASIADRNGNQITLGYDGRGLLSHVRASDGLVHHLQLDLDGRITEISRTDGRSRQILASYAYGADHALITARNAAGNALLYAYEAGLMTRQTRRNGRSIYYEWDDIAFGGAAKCTRSHSDGGYGARTLMYLATRLQTIVRSAQGRTETYRWNSIGLVEAIVSPRGAISTAHFDRYGHCLSRSDANGARASVRHDRFGRIVESIDANGAISLFTYADADPQSPLFHRLARWTNALGHSVDCRYDACGNLISYSDATDSSILVVRNAMGLPVMVRDIDGVLARYEWSDEGRLVAAQTLGRTHIRYRYDGFGARISRSDEGHGHVLMHYDTLGRLIEKVATDGAISRYVYDGEGNLVQFTDARGKQTSWDYAGLSVPVSRTNPDGSRFRYRYDSEMNVIGLQNELGEVYALEYDADGRLIAEIGFDTRRRRYHHDDAGHLTRVDDGHRSHKLKHDACGRLISRQSTDGSWARFAYDAMGRLTLAQNEVCAVTFTRDPRGLLLTEEQGGKAIRHAYSARGERVVTLLPDGRRIGYRHDSGGLLSGVLYEDHDVMRLKRDLWGREISRDTDRITMATAFDAQGRIMQQLAVTEGQPSPLMRREYIYQIGGDLAEMQDAARGERQFHYDARGHLVQVMGDDNEAFVFDEAGQMLADLSRATDGSVMGGRMLIRGDTRYLYDDAGNRIETSRGAPGQWQLQMDYDDLNQLSEMRESSAGVMRSTRFAYDALGRRVMKHHSEALAPLVAANDPGAASGADPPGAKPSAARPPAARHRESYTWFVWDGDVLLAEGKGTGNGARDPLSVLYIHEPQSWRPVAQVRRSVGAPDGQVMAYWLDNIGTPQEMTDGQGRVVWRAALKTWGATASEDALRCENNLRFPGQYLDRETGLHYNRYRHFDPASGSYVSQNPVGLTDSASLYRYATDPLNYTNPEGLHSVATDFAKTGPFDAHVAQPDAPLVPLVTALTTQAGTAFGWLRPMTVSAPGGAGGCEAMSIMPKGLGLPHAYWIARLVGPVIGHGDRVCDGVLSARKSLWGQMD